MNYKFYKNSFPECNSIFSRLIRAPCDDRKCDTYESISGIYYITERQSIALNH